MVWEDFFAQFFTRVDGSLHKVMLAGPCTQTQLMPVTICWYTIHVNSPTYLPGETCDYELKSTTNRRVKNFHSIADNIYHFEDLFCFLFFYQTHPVIFLPFQMDFTNLHKPTSDSDMDSPYSHVTGRHWAHMSGMEWSLDSSVFQALTHTKSLCCIFMYSQPGGTTSSLCLSPAFQIHPQLG